LLKTLELLLKTIGLLIKEKKSLYQKGKRDLSYKKSIIKKTNELFLRNELLLKEKKYF
jgi:hypothetical protein